MIKPKKLNEGDKVAIVSLSSGVLGESELKYQLELGVKRLNELGLEPVFMTNTLKGLNYIFDHPEKRASDLKEAFKDDSIKGIICAIGGDDTYKTIPYLMDDKEFKELVLTKPKIFVGFSDSTNNHLMFNKLGLVTYYGLNYLSDLCELQSEMIPYTKQSYQRLFRNDKEYNLISSPVWYLNRTSYGLDQINTNLKVQNEINGYDFIYGKGRVEGIFWGGCLESIYDIYTSDRYENQRSIYEKYDLIPSVDFFKDKILFVETSEEKPSPDKFKEMLDVVIKENILQNIKCLLVGKPFDEIYFNEYRDILNDIANKLNLSIVYNLNFGHALPRIIIPYGVKGEVDFKLKTVKVIEQMFK